MDDKKHSISKKSIVTLGLVIIVIIAAIIIVPQILPSLSDEIQSGIAGEEGKVTTVAQSTLEAIVKQNKLYTAEYPYNGYASVYDTDGTTLKYYVAYQGKVKAGIDVTQISVSLDEETHTITIQLPEVKVEEPTVDIGGLEFIFSHKKYETETVTEEAYREAISDLKRRVSEDDTIIRTATESAKTIEKALVEPWVNQVNEDVQYTVNVLGYGE